MEAGLTVSVPRTIAAGFAPPVSVGFEAGIVGAMVLVGAGVEGTTVATGVFVICVGTEVVVGPAVWVGKAVVATAVVVAVGSAVIFAVAVIVATEVVPTGVVVIVTTVESGLAVRVAGVPVAVELPFVCDANASVVVNVAEGSVPAAA